MRAVEVNLHHSAEAGGGLTLRQHQQLSKFAVAEELGLDPENSEAAAIAGQAVWETGPGQLLFEKAPPPPTARAGHRPSLAATDESWDCSLCSTRNTAGAMECSMCHSVATQWRELHEQQQQQREEFVDSTKGSGGSGESTRTGGSGGAGGGGGGGAAGDASAQLPSIGEMKQALTAINVSTAGVVEKRDLDALFRRHFGGAGGDDAGDEIGNGPMGEQHDGEGLRRRHGHRK